MHAVTTSIMVICVCGCMDVCVCLCVCVCSTQWYIVDITWVHECVALILASFILMHVLERTEWKGNDGVLQQNLVYDGCMFTPSISGISTFQEVNRKLCFASLLAEWKQPQYPWLRMVTVLVGSCNIGLMIYNWGLGLYLHSMPEQGKVVKVSQKCYLGFLV